MPLEEAHDERRANRFARSLWDLHGDLRQIAPKADMWNPLSLVPAGMRPWLLVISIVLSLTVFLFMRRTVATVQPRPGCLQFAWTSTRASEILTEWNKAENGVMRLVRLNLALDFMLIVTYVIGIALACALAADAIGAARWPGAGMGGALVWAIIIAGLFDAVENVAQLRMLAGHTTQPWPALASVCASVKFLLVALASLYAFYGGAAFLFRCFEARFGS
jgi:hypothetical protein